MRTDRVSPENSSLTAKVKPIIFGISGGALICALALLLFSLIISMNNIPQSAVTPLATTAASVGAFFGGLMTARMIRVKGALFGAITGFVLFAVLFIVSVSAAGETLGMATLIKLISMPVAGALGGILGVNLRKR